MLVSQMVEAASYSQFHYWIMGIPFQLQSTAKSMQIKM